MSPIILESEEGVLKTYSKNIILQIYSFKNIYFIPTVNVCLTPFTSMFFPAPFNELDFSHSWIFKADISTFMKPFPTLF